MVQPAVRSALTAEEYLAFERESEVKHEFADGEIFVMSGGSWEHDQIAGNLFAALHAAVRRGRCSVSTSDQRVKIPATGRYTYPDATVVCGEPEFEDERRDSLRNPTAIFEVLSDSTESYDRGEKFAQYRTLDSLTDYVLVAQTQAQVEHYGRQGDGSWLLRVLGAADTLRLEGAAVEVPVAEIYRDVLERATGTRGALPDG